MKKSNSLMKQKLIGIVGILLSMIFSSSCISVKEVPPPQYIGSWIVYWDGDRGLAELERHKGLFRRVSMFAYELDAEGFPQYAPGFDEIRPRFLSLSQKNGFSPWVTVVNDMRVADKVFLKNSEILRKIMTTTDNRKKHIQKLVEQVKKDGFAGLDLDYEGLEISDQEDFRVYITELGKGLKDSGLGFNVVVEPKKGPLPIPRTVSLTVMGYNLHGPHSKPGPRATPDFILSLKQRGKGDVYAAPELAIAVGGFMWLSDGKVKQLDWVTGQKLSVNAIQNRRQIFSRVPYAYLEGGSEIWFEDTDSIQAKWAAAYKSGFRSIMIWRLGGNDDNLFAFLKNLQTSVKDR
ncbi:MAG: glycosyl hydrolase family 18 protein [Thermodesulfovibrionales bacterium]